MTRRAWRWVLRLLLAAPLPWAVFTVALYGAAIGATAVLAPRVSNETIAWIVLVGTFTAAVTTLLQLLTDRARAKAGGTPRRLTDAEAKRLIRHLSAKVRHAGLTSELDTVATIVADTLLVAEGSLAVDDFAPPRGRS